MIISHSSCACPLDVFQVWWTNTCAHRILNFRKYFCELSWKLLQLEAAAYHIWYLVNYVLSPTPCCLVCVLALYSFASSIKPFLLPNRTKMCFFGKTKKKKWSDGGLMYDHSVPDYKDVSYYLIQMLFTILLAACRETVAPGDLSWDNRTRVSRAGCLRKKHG